MAKLSDLPSELVEQILADLTQPAYSSLSFVSKSLYTIVTPYLYRDIDLLVRSNDHVPRADRLFFNILDETALGKHVRSLRLGVKTYAPLRDIRRCMPKASKTQHQRNLQKAMNFMDTWPVILDAGDFDEALEANDYGAYAALLFLLVLPTLQCISIAENDDETLRPLKTVLDNIKARGDKEGVLSLKCIEGIKEVVYNFDYDTATPYPQNSQNTLWQALLLPTMQKLEIPSLTNFRGARWAFPTTLTSFRPSSPLTSLTCLILRYTRNVTETLHGVLPETPQLRSLTCEACYDCSEISVASRRPPNPWISLDEWNAALCAVKNTLQTLVLSVEFYDENCTFFSQPDIKPQVSGRLDLRGFDQLHTLDVPVPFLIGDPSISIFMDTNYLPYAPPFLTHLTLQTGMTDAQFVYPWDTSIRATGPTFEESKDESRVRDNARMDLGCIFQLSLSLIDQLPYLQSFAIMQPPDPSLDFFDDQLEDLRTSCKNKSITARVIYPMLLRRKSPVHWDLVREVTLFDARFPECGPVARMFRGERRGLPLGLASQYHLSEFKKHHVRRHR